MRCFLARNVIKMLSYIGISHIDYLAGIDDYSLYSGFVWHLAWLFCHWEHLGTRMKKKMLSYILSKVYERCDLWFNFARHAEFESGLYLNEGLVGCRSVPVEGFSLQERRCFALPCGKHFFVLR